MTPNTRRGLVSTGVAIALLLQGCSTPTLVEVARRRQATDDDRAASRNVRDDVRVKYSVTDWDVLNFTDEVKRKLANRSSFHMGVRYGSAGTQATLGALAGAAKTFGWGISTASGFGLGATYIFGMGQIFDAKSHAQAYEQSFTAIQAAEATYYFNQLGMGFETDKATGKTIVLKGDKNGRSDIPSQTNITPDGATLYYRVSKILKVLGDMLASKIPDLQDLKDAKGDSTGGPASPAAPSGPSTSTSDGAHRTNSGTATHVISSPAATTGGATPATRKTSEPDTGVENLPSPEPKSDDVAVLRDYWTPKGVPAPERTAIFNAWLKEHEGGIDIDTFLNSTDPKYTLERARARAKLITTNPVK